MDYQFTDGSAHLLKNYNVVCGGSRYKEYDVPKVILTNGNASTFTPVSLATAIPASNVGRVKLQVTYTPHAAGEFASLQTFGATGTAFTFDGIVASVAQTTAFDIVSALNAGVPSINYSVSVATAPAALSLSVIGYEFSI